MIVVKIALKNLNQAKLAEEAQALAFASVIGRVDWYGFDRLDDRVLTPIAARLKVGEVNGVADFADPGELRFVTSRDLTPAEEAQIDGVLIAHDAGVLTAGQQREDQDEVDLTDLVTAYNAFQTFLTNFDAAGNVTQLKAALRPFCINVAKAMRVIVRKYRDAQL